MRLRHAVTTVLLALCCADSVAARGIWRPERRQDAADTSTATDVASTSSTPHSDSASSTPQPTSTSIESHSSSPVPTSAASHTHGASTATSEAPASREAAVISTSPAVSPTATAHGDRLPLQPKITPAIGIAGVLLIVAGVVLCLFGARHKEIHIFLSSALLGSLAVTVLIVYVMHPPVKDAIQGAYLVAAVVTGLIIGSVALVFKDVTEGMGTLLGGFCLAMWFLVLSPGGLVTSTAGKDIMIAVFLVVFFSLSLSHWTRTYGLIGCTSFAGAEVTLLGVDCFSRAGLKEFWLYIWNLNSDEFPLGTNTYPVTRGIKVEVACTIILFLFGVMSQLRIWETVKQRRARKHAARMQDDERRDQLEAAVGKEIETNNERDRAQWETVYGDKDRSQGQVDSGVGSSIDSFAKRSTGTTEREVVDDIELASLPSKPAKRSSKHDQRSSKHDGRPVVTVRAASEDEPSHPPQTTQSEENLLGKNDLSRSTSYKSVVSDFDDATSVKDWQQRSSAGAGPPVPPMPFTIPGLDKESHEGSAGSDHESVRSAGSWEPEHTGLPLTHSSLQNKDRAGTPHVEEDANSSVAATADEDVDVDTLSADRLAQTPSPYQLELGKDTLGPPRNDERDRSRSPRMSMIEVPVMEEDEEVIDRPATAREEPQRSASTHNKGRSTTAGSPRRSVASKRSAGNSASDDEGDHTSAVGPLKDHLPQKLSKVAMTYRTSEWAKHITDADKPDFEEEAESTSPGIQVDHVFAEEAAKAANTDDLKPAETPQVSRNVSNASSNNPYRRSMQAAPQPPVRSSSASATPVYAFQRSASLQRQSSNPRLTVQSQRNTSAPLMAQTLVESPVEDVERPSGPYRNFSTPLASSNNLMDERNDRLKRKPTTMSFNALTSTSELNIQAGPDTTSVRQSHIDQPDSDHITLAEHQQPHDEENMTLAERKALIQQREHVLRPATSHEQITPRHSALPPPARVRSMTSAPKKESLIYDSHQPKRTKTVDTVRQSAMMTQWHQSLHAEAARQQPVVDENAMREQVLAERRQAEWEQQRQQAERVNRESMLDMAMRSGQFHDAHRDAMRRMQAKANKGAPQ